jgi:hypothetical protein
MAQSGRERASCFLSQRAIDHPGDSLERGKKHLDAPVAIKKKPRRIRKAVNGCSDLNGHVESPSSPASNFERNSNYKPATLWQDSAS